MRHLVLIKMLTAAIALFLSANCGNTVMTTPEVHAIAADRITLDPDDSVWENAPTHIAKLILQDLVEPRQMEPTTAEVRVKAITKDGQIAFRMEWSDDTLNDAPGPRKPVDAAAVQLPAVIQANAPAPQMGEQGMTVEIAYWRADWQASVNGRPDGIRALHPNASVDHHPYEAKPLENNEEARRRAELRYAPAKALGNVRSGPREVAFEDLIAEGPGTLTPAPARHTSGTGKWSDTGWAVVFVRPIPNGFSATRPTQVAFAVWEGTHGEAGSRKMRTGWINLLAK